MTVISPTGGLLAGFDAGQTHTRCRLSQRDGLVVAEGEGSGVSHLGSEQGPERFGRALQSSLEAAQVADAAACLLYTSPSPRDKRQSRMPSSA